METILSEKILNYMEELEVKYNELEEKMSNTHRITPEELKDLAKEHSKIQDLVFLHRSLKDINKSIEETENLKRSGDSEILVLVEEELKELTEKKNKLEMQIREKYLSGFETISEDKNVIIEIRAGAGGNEASIFAGDLFRMYSKYAESKNWKVEVLSSHPTDLGGFKEIIFSIKGKGSYRKMNFESGVHRVQRVPITEASGRIHTSTCTVAVLQEAEEVDIKIEPSELKIDTFRSSSAGGQKVNKTDSAVRITHIPTGKVVECQDERSQYQNKDKALRILRSILLAEKIKEQQEQRALDRRQQIKSGERSEKMRTYNYPQNRITEHRIPFTLYRLSEVMEGDLDLILEPLEEYYIRQKLGNT